MIRLEQVTKLFDGHARPAVDAIELEVPDGETCVLIGPSGCGKTTTLRMVNRLIEPSSGRIIVQGEDVTRADPVQLRRHIGYVIQGIGLFPHMSVAANVATVPRLLGWPKPRIAHRVDEMLSLVGLDPTSFGQRKPASLSGGQRQRVGVARALAADPPVMLMDEPFGAVDPVVRSRLQGEFAEILRRLGKTVIMVTHDIDEAVRMGDRIAIMRAGRILQHATPDRILSRPADDFVAGFVGADRALKRLTLLTAGEVASPGGTAKSGLRIAAEENVHAALSIMLAEGADDIAVYDRAGGFEGVLRFDQVRRLAQSVQPGEDASPGIARSEPASTS